MKRIRPRPLAWGIPALVLIAVHLGAHWMQGEEGARWLYYSRAGLYTLGLMFAGAWVARVARGLWSHLVPQLFVLAALLCATDVVFHFLRGRPPVASAERILPDYAPDHPGHHMGDLPPAGSVQPAVKVVDGDTLLRAVYTYDNEFRRVTPAPADSTHRHALFFGCSVAFGQWMDDGSTLPAQFQMAVPGIRAYNYAYPGWGTNHMLARLEYQDLSTQVDEPDGIGIYVFIWPHIYRSAGDMYTYCSWGFQHPHYVLENGEVVRKGHFKDGRPVRSWLYERLWESNLVRYFDLNLPLFITERDLRLSVAIIDKARDLYLQQFPRDRFVLLWAQDFPVPKEAHLQERYLQLLLEAGIEVIDGRRPHLMDHRYTLPNDGHPTARAYADMASILLRGLDRLGWRP